MKVPSKNVKIIIVCEAAQPFALTGTGAGVDSAWEQKKFEVRKMLDAKRAARPTGSPTLPALTSEAAPKGQMHAVLG